MPKVKFQGWKGVNKDLAPAELDLNTWSDVLNFRFKSGFAEKFGGITELATPSVTPTALFISPQLNSDATNFVYASNTKVYATDSNTAGTEITKAIPAVTVSGITDVAGAGATRELTTSSPHGLSSGNDVRVYGCTGADANMYNATEANITVMSTTVFRYDGGDSGTPGGAAAGTPAYEVLQGPVENFTGGTLTGGPLNGYLILGNNTDGVFYWQASTAYDIRRFSVLTTSYPAQVTRVFKNWIVQLAPYISSNWYYYRVLWSNAAEPGSVPTSFTASSTNDAGSVDLAWASGGLVDCAEFNDVNYIYGRNVRYAMRWIGGNSVFDFEKVEDQHGVREMNCIANCEVGQVFLTREWDIRIHNGGPSRSIARGRVFNYLRGDVSTTVSPGLVTNPVNKEVWVCYAPSGQTSWTRALVWNWEDDTWTIRSLPSVKCAASGIFQPIAGDLGPLIWLATATPKLGYTDNGTTDLGSTITATLERIGIHADELGRKKTLHTSRWILDATAANTASIYHGYHIAPDASATYGSAVTYTQGTTRDVNSFGNSAEYMAIKLSTTATDMKVRTAELIFNADGEF